MGWKSKLLIEQLARHSLMSTRVVRRLHRCAGLPLPSSFVYPSS